MYLYNNNLQHCLPFRWPKMIPVNNKLKECSQFKNYKNFNRHFGVLLNTLLAQECYNDRSVLLRGLFA